MCRLLSYFLTACECNVIQIQRFNDSRIKTCVRFPRCILGIRWVNMITYEPWRLEVQMKMDRAHGKETTHRSLWTRRETQAWNIKEQLKEVKRFAQDHVISRTTMDALCFTMGRCMVKKRRMSLIITCMVRDLSKEFTSSFREAALWQYCPTPV